MFFSNMCVCMYILMHVGVQSYMSIGFHHDRSCVCLGYGYALEQRYICMFVYACIHIFTYFSGDREKERKEKTETRMTYKQNRKHSLSFFPHITLV
jgi:hypothetical protein